MSASARVLILSAIVTLPSLSWANGLQFRSSYSYYYAYPTVTYRVICPEPAYVMPECPPQQREMLQAPPKYAQPSPAGPSGKPITPKTTEPPRAPGVSESRSSYFSAYAVAPRASERPSGERCKVGFWNLSEREITLVVENKKYPLPRGKSIKIELGREFVWKVDDRTAQTEKVPASESAMEIVIRR